MRHFVVAVALVLNAGAAVAVPLELPESVRTALATARSAQKENRNAEAIEAGRAAFARNLADPTVQSWHLAPLLRTMSEVYRQSGSPELAALVLTMASSAMQTAPDRHDDMRRWFAAEAANGLRRIGALRAEREHMNLALHDLVPFMARSEHDDRVAAVETLLDDARLSIAEGNIDAACASLVPAGALSHFYGINSSAFQEDLSELLALVLGDSGQGVPLRYNAPPAGIGSGH